MSRIIPITPTAMGAWNTCPRQFRAKYITKEVQYTETVHTRFGIYVHGALENRLKHGTPLSSDLAFLEPIAARVGSFHGEVLVEAEVCINREMKAVPWKDKGVWQRAKGDVLLVDRQASRAIVIDWKTSKGKSERERERFGDEDTAIQERVLALCTAINFQVNEVVTCFVYPYKPGVPGAVINTYHPADNAQMGPHYMMCTRFEMAQKRGDYPPKPSGLCKSYCDVRTCQHNHRLPQPIRDYLVQADAAEAIDAVTIESLEQVFGGIKL